MTSFDTEPSPLPPSLSTGRGSVTFTLAVALCALFALLYTPYWHRGGDSDVYLAIARNLARGDGLTFNGNPVVVVPPLWPMLLAAGLKVSTSFLWLKLLPMMLLIAALVVWFRILLRWLSYHGAAAIVLLTAVSPLVFPFSTLFYSEPMFMLLTALALLLAMQISEGRPAIWRGGAIALLMILAVGVRWTAPLWWMLTAGALLSTRNRATMHRGAIIAAVSAFATLGAFYLERHLLAADPSQIDPSYDSSLAVRYAMSNVTGVQDLLWRMVNAGAWMGGALWPVTRELGTLRLPGLIVGWIILIPLTIWTIGEARQRRWLPVAMLLHGAALVFLWPNIVPRYLVPMLPLIFTFTWVILSRIRIGRPRAAPVSKDDGEIRAEMPVLTYADKATQPAMSVQTTPVSAVGRTAGALVFASIAFCGIAFFAVEFWAVRFGDFYDRFQAGTNRSLIDVIERLRRETLNPGEVAINRCDINYNRQRIGNTWLRAANVLLDLPIRNPPDELCRPPDIGVAEWMRNERIRFLLHREPSLTMWHFRMRASANQTSPTGEPWTGRWRLYELTAAGLHEVAVERTQLHLFRLTDVQRAPMP